MLRYLRINVLFKGVNFKVFTMGSLFRQLGVRAAACGKTFKLFVNTWKFF